jgi:HK97 family phage prohead protease
MPTLKTLPARVKLAEGSTDDGVIEALVATYDVDTIGDRIIPGAFTKSLEEWAESGHPIPFIWSHMHNDLDAYLGDVLEAKEIDDGLWIKAQIDMEDSKAAKAFRLLKGGRVRNYSFAYDVVDAGPDEDGPGETALKELRLYEVGPTLIGMNRQTRTLTAKTDGVDEGYDEDEPTETKEAVSDKPWSDFPNSAFTDEQYARSAILDRGPDFSDSAKQRYSLPVREPDGTLNRNAAHNAAAVLGGARGGVNATTEQKATAARKLVAIYTGSLDEDPPESLRAMAGKEQSSRPDVGEKAGRVLSAKNEADLRQAATLISGVLAQLETSSTTSQGTTSASGPATDKEPPGATAKEPSRATPVNTLAALIAITRLKGDGR